MERWLLLFFVGACCALLFEQVPALYYLLSLALSCFCVAIFAYYYKRILSLLALLSGFTYILFAANAHISWAANNSIDVKTLHLNDLLVQGTINSLITHDNDILRFNVAIKSINSQQLSQPFNARITYRKPKIILSQGDTVRLLVKLKPAHGFANEGSFSYQKWLLQNHIVASGYVKKSSNNRVLLKQPSVRQILYNELTQKIHQPLKPLILALSLGDKSQIDKPMWQILQTTGTQHLMAISGLHLGLIAGFGFSLMKLIIYLLPKQLLSQRYLYILPMITSLLFACCYSYLAGFAVPTVRAFIMLVWFYGLKFSYTKVTVIKWLLLSLVTIILIEPFAILDTSLYLSFSAVLVIFFSFWRWRHVLDNKPKWQRVLLSLLLMQGAISVFLMPLTLLLFKKVSIIAPFANVLVVPWLSFTAIPIILIATMTLLFLPVLSIWLFSVANLCLELSIKYLQWLTTLDYSILTFSTPLLIAVCLMPLALFLCSLKLINIKQVVIVLLPTVVTFTGIELGVNYWQKSNKFWLMTVFDVGHGLAVLIEKDGKTMLYDSGAAYDSGFNFAEAVIEPYLISKRSPQIDLVIISHSDNDHAGGLPYLLEHNLVKSFSANFAELENNTPCIAGKLINWYGLELKMLWPKQAVGEHNDESCVLEISDGKHRVLLPGDISGKVERRLLRQNSLTKVDVLIAPHHGSKSSSMVSFVQFIQPEYVVYSSGFLNRWNMPVAAVVNRYQQINAKELNTSKVGMVQFKFTRQGITFKTYRNNLLPFWPWR